MGETKSNYLWDNSATSEVSQRFRSLEIMYDSITFQHIESLGIWEGWKCLEVGGGGGSVTKWLSEKVGKSGRVLVTDINPIFLKDFKTELGNVDVLQHDITSESGIPKDAFDLAHARLVLIHLAQREKALVNMVSSLKSGGWVMIEDFDLILNELLLPREMKKDNEASEIADLFNRLMQARNKLLREHGADPSYARGLYSMMLTQGLVDVGMSAAGARSWRGGSAGAKLHIANSMQSKDELIMTGLLSGKEFDKVIKMLNDPDWLVFSPLMFSAWGRKP